MTVNFRIGIATLTVGASALASVLAACSSDDSASPPATPGPDASYDANTGSDASDASANDADAGPKLAKTILVHGSPDLPPLRLCFGVGVATDGSDTTLSPLPALPHRALPGQPYAGLFPGTGGPLPFLGVDLSAKIVTAFVIPAAKIAAENGDAPGEKTCVDLIGEHGRGGTLIFGTDFVQFPPDPPGTFAYATTSLIVATGCFPTAVDPNASAARCGDDYDAAKGNLLQKIVRLDQTPPSDTSTMGIQFAHMSQPIAAAAKGAAAADGGASFVLGFVRDDGGARTIVTTNETFGTVAPSPAAAQSGIVASAASTEVFGALFVGGAATPAAAFALPLPTVTLLTTGSANPTYFANGQNYTFVVLGDPSQPTFVDPNDGGPSSPDAGGIFNGYAPHFLAFPNDPSLPAYR